ncbi:MAG: glycosyl hydrolase 115 family protein [Treponema sp.]|nr:glycosyl hydrolase 115 family protein [Treponema sp.]
MAKTLDRTKAEPSQVVIAPPDETMHEESWLIEVTPEKMTVCSGGGLGCVYALLYISERFLGVTPFWFWNDQGFTRRSFVPIPPGLYRSPHYAVRFRGWYVNDEVLIENWAGEPANTEHWLMVFEAMLRCGGNMVIPGTDTNSRKYRVLAADMGLWITHHHSEPLGAQMFARAYPGETPSYTERSALFEQLWEQAVIDQKNYRVIWGLGFRGQGDYPFWENDSGYATAARRGELISAVMNRQYEILKRHLDNPVCCVNLYGELMELCREGAVTFPPGAIKVWADNGYGRMVSRRQGNHNPRIPALPSSEDTGPHGIYYHCSFHDLQASNHLTMSPNPAEFLAAELEKSLDAGAGEYWIINSGSVKPHVHTLALVSELWRAGRIDVSAWRSRYAKTYFGEQKTEVIAGLFAEYAAAAAEYGPNEDDRAGEQIWHHPVRELLCRWISGDAESRVESLAWLTGNVSFPGQIQKLEAICRESLPRWEAFCARCAALLPALDERGRRLFNDSLYLQGRLQRDGAAGALAFCESFYRWNAGDIVRAFVTAEKSRSCYDRSSGTLVEAEHDGWAGYYRGDCLTDVRLTASCLEALVSYLRITGDGPDFHRWERDFLEPAGERKVMLLSSKQRAMSNSEMAEALWPVRRTETN